MDRKTDSHYMLEALRLARKGCGRNSNNVKDWLPQAFEETEEHISRIIVLKGGEIVEQGSRDELLAHRGTFFKLHQMQFSLNTADVDNESLNPA